MMAVSSKIVKTNSDDDKVDDDMINRNEDDGDADFGERRQR